jgi:hypothetical protein
MRFPVKAHFRKADARISGKSKAYPFYGQRAAGLVFAARVFLGENGFTLYLKTMCRAPGRGAPAFSECCA